MFGNVVYKDNDFDIPRSSMDNILGNNFGKHSVNLRGVFDIHFLNGGSSVDRCAKFTLFLNNGASVL